jgi:hypothetical protein
MSSGSRHQHLTRQLAFQGACDAAWKILALANVTLVNPRTGQPVLRH